MVIMNGKQLAEKVLNEISVKQQEILIEYGRPAGLAVVIVGENPASKVYVANKIKACNTVGFHSMTHKLEDSSSEEELLSLIDNLNKDESIDGILVQLPLPKHINELKIINAIAPEKDVDGFHPVNIGKMLINDETGFLPCTPYGILQILDEYKIDVKGKDVVVVGRSNIVGKPISVMLVQRSATVQICNSSTKNMSEKLQQADIIIAATGVPKLIKEEDVKEGVVIIDVGINRLDGKLCGDVDYENVSKKASYITPVPGGVGPMTIASLIKNTYKSYKLKKRGSYEGKN